jgi:hypothetical protein
MYGTPPANGARPKKRSAPLTCATGDEVGDGKADCCEVQPATMPISITPTSNGVIHAGTFALEVLPDRAR